jgi:hypothetical protein
VRVRRMDCLESDDRKELFAFFAQQNFVTKYEADGAWITQFNAMHIKSRRKFMNSA